MEGRGGEFESHMRLSGGGADRPVGPGRHSQSFPDSDFEDRPSRIGEARHRLAAGIENVGAVFEERPGLVRKIRENPLAATTLAFSVGFLVAATTTIGTSHWAVDRIRRQLRTAIISGITAALAHELRELFSGEDGLAGILGDFDLGEDDLPI